MLYCHLYITKSFPSIWLHKRLSTFCSFVSIWEQKIEVLYHLWKHIYSHFNPNVLYIYIYIYHVYRSLTVVQRERQYHFSFNVGWSESNTCNEYNFTFQVIHEKKLCEKWKFLKAFHYKVCDEKIIAWVLKKIIILGWYLLSYAVRAKFGPTTCIRQSKYLNYHISVSMLLWFFDYLSHFKFL